MKLGLTLNQRCQPFCNINVAEVSGLRSNQLYNLYY